MKTTQGNMLLSLRNVQGFLQSHASHLAAVIATGVTTRLNAAITALTGHATHCHDFFSSLLNQKVLSHHSRVQRHCATARRVTLREAVDAVKIGRLIALECHDVWCDPSDSLAAGACFRLAHLPTRVHCVAP